MESSAALRHTSALTKTCIEDHAVIGDCRSAALVTIDGTIDWLCLPHFGSDSVFAAILDPLSGGFFRVRPTACYEVRRDYEGESNVLRTVFETETGVVRLRDAMPVASEERKEGELWPEHEVLRVVECLAGQVEIEVVYAPRPSMGRDVPRIEDRGPTLGFAAQRRGQLLLLRSDAELEVAESSSIVRGRFRLAEGERRSLSMTFCNHEPAVLTALNERTCDRLDQSRQWWQDWAARCPYRGEFRDVVIRSLLTVKQLSFAPSGAIVAAVTTSLPEQIGGTRNWDYRFCWIRDASMTVRLLLRHGYSQEATAFIGWLLHTTRRTAPDLQTLYDVFGQPSPTEVEIPWLSGYRGSKPVRVGNGAHDQLQLDSYGELIDAVWEYVDQGGQLESASRRLLRKFGDLVCQRWREPDEGIWEVRSGRRHFTHSKVMCWVALDRLISMSEQGALAVPVERYRQVRGAIRQEIEERARHPDGHYVSIFDTDRLDAALLLLPYYGYVDYRSDAMVKTVELIKERLCEGALVYRYRDQDDGLAGKEGAFGICSFWMVSCLAHQGAIAEALERFRELLEMNNDLGLFAEEIDTRDLTPLGNFPQAFTHLGLIDAAMAIEEARGEKTAVESFEGTARGQKQ